MLCAVVRGAGVAAALLCAPAAHAEDLFDLGVETHGFVSQGFILTTDNDFLANNSTRGSFEFTEVGINFTKGITDELRVGMQLFMRDLGPIGNYRAHFDWFYLDYRLFDWLGLRAGRTKVPFGLYNETNDIDSARVSILLPQAVYSVRNRDYLLAQTGVEAYGYLGPGALGALEYRLYGGTIYLDQPPAQPGAPAIVWSLPFIAGGRLMWQTPLSGLQLGATVQWFRLEGEYQIPDADAATFQMAGLLPADFENPLEYRVPAAIGILSAEYVSQNLLLAAEYARSRVSASSSAPKVLPELPTTQSEAFHVMASYTVAPWFTPGVYYAASFPNVDDRKGRDAYQHDLALSLRYDLTANWLLKFEGHYMVGTSGLDPAINHVPLDQLTREWGVFLAKTTAYF